MKKLKLNIYFLFFLLCLIPLNLHCAHAEPIKKIAILPFETNTRQNLAYMVDGVISMLQTRLTWKDNIEVIDGDQTRNALSTINFESENQIPEIADKMKADYIVSGIITEFSGAFSIDTKIYNIKDQTVLTFFDQSKTIDDVISKVDIVAAKINKKVFDRTTVSYEKFKKDNIITEEELRRMNPEKMMPQIRPFDEQDKPWWKIW